MSKASTRQFLAQKTKLGESVTVTVTVTEYLLRITPISQASLFRK
jgi:hypothetical protein